MIKFIIILFICIIVTFIATPIIIVKAIWKSLKKNANKLQPPLHICYPGCLKLKHMLLKSMKSILANNNNVTFYIINNGEYRNDDVNDLARELDNFIANSNTANSNTANSNTANSNTANTANSNTANENFLQQTQQTTFLPTLPTEITEKRFGKNRSFKQPMFSTLTNAKSYQQSRLINIAGNKSLQSSESSQQVTAFMPKIVSSNYSNAMFKQCDNYGVQEMFNANSNITARNITYKINVIDVSPWMHVFEDFNKLKGSLNCYVRILIPRIFQNHFPNVKRVIYLDEDTFCNGDLQKLYNYNCKGAFAAFIDWNHYLKPVHITNKDINEGWLEKTNYICTGIMLMDTKFNILNDAFIKTMNLYKIISIYNLPVTTHDQFIYNVYGTTVIKKYNYAINYTGDEHEVYTILSNYYLKHFNILHDWYLKLSNFDKLRSMGVNV